MANSQNSESVKKLLETLQSDLKNISLETRKKHPGVKESAEEAIVKIRNAGHANTNTPLAYLSNQILYPLVQVCPPYHIGNIAIEVSRGVRRRTRRR